MGCESAEGTPLTIRAAPRTAERPIRVVYFGRKSGRAYGSIETVFRVIRPALPDDISYRLRPSRFQSRGVFRRIFNTIEAAIRQDEVNHVTGDVHFLTFLMGRRRTILTILDLVGLTRSNWLRRRSIEWLWYRLPVRRAAIVTTISESTRKQLVDLLGETMVDIRVIPCCISPAFRPSPKEFCAKEPTILAVGTGENKNLLRLVDALRGLRCRLLIVGELLHAQREALARNGVQYENRQHLTEDQMVEAYVECDMLAFASTYEGFGMPILEAQAVERPVVTSSVASMPEVAGEGACLVNPFDVASIRAGVLRVMHDATYRRSLVVAGRRNCTRFSPREIAEAYACVYREIAAAQISGDRTLRDELVAK